MGKKSCAAQCGLSCLSTLCQGCVAVTMDTPDASADGYVGTAPPSGIRSAVPLGGIGRANVVGRRRS